MQSSKPVDSYGSETSISLVLDDLINHLSFSSPEEARAWIRRIAGRKDYFGRNESTRSTYAVTKVEASASAFCTSALGAAQDSFEMALVAFSDCAIMAKLWDVSIAPRSRMASPFSTPPTVRLNRRV